MEINVSTKSNYWGLYIVTHLSSETSFKKTTFINAIAHTDITRSSELKQVNALIIVYCLFALTV